MKKLHLECLPDECLVKTLGQPDKLIEHHNDKGRVCNHLKKNKGLIALIDEDPGSAQPSYLHTLIEVSNTLKIRILEDKKLKNRVIILCPRLEEWIIEVCHKSHVSPESFDLSKSPTTLHREINGKMRNFQRLLKHLLDEVKAPHLLYLKEILH